MKRKRYTVEQIVAAVKQYELGTLKKIVADPNLDKAMLTDIAKKVVKAPQRREAVTYLRSHYGVSERWTCLIVGQPRSVQWYKSQRPPQYALECRITELAEVRIR